MVLDNPSRRPEIDEVVRRFDKMVLSLSHWKLRSRLVELEEREWAFLTTFRAIAHLFRTIIHILTFRNPIPHPPS